MFKKGVDLQQSVSSVLFKLNRALATLMHSFRLMAITFSHFEKVVINTVLER